MTSTFRVEALTRICYACGNIILKNGHRMSEQVSEMITEAFAMQNAEENITPMQACHNCWRAAKHYSEKKALGQHHILTKVTVGEWLPHSFDECITCNLYATNKNGKKKKKNNKRELLGRPKEIGNKSHKLSYYFSSFFSLDSIILPIISHNLYF